MKSISDIPTSSHPMKTSPNVQMEIRPMVVTPLVENKLEGGAGGSQDLDAAPMVKPSPKKLTKGKRSSTCVAVSPRHKVSFDQAVEQAEALRNWRAGCSFLSGDLALESEPRPTLVQNRKRSSASFATRASKNRAQEEASTSQSGQETLVEPSVKADADAANLQVKPVDVPLVADTSPPEVKKKKNRPSSGLIPLFRGTSPTTELTNSKSLDNLNVVNKGRKMPMLTNRKSKPTPSTSQKSKDETPFSTPSTSPSVSVSQSQLSNVNRNPTSSRVAKRRNPDSESPTGEELRLRKRKQAVSPAMLCFVCQTGRNVQKCNKIECNRHYHVDCLNPWRQTKRIGETFICPLHVCHTCWAKDDSVMCPPNGGNASLQKCTICPTAYHTGHDCIAAGSESQTNAIIRCAKHLEVTVGLEHTSAPWCFICAKGGRLICCEYCSSSFHGECLQIEEPEGPFICHNCESGRLPLYHDVVWVKLGRKRWWPAQIRKPEEIPDNIENLPHGCGEFCVQFFGTHGYFWVNRGRCFFFQEDDISGKNFSMGPEFFKKAVTEAGQSHQKHLQPPPFSKIDVNRPVGKAKVFECEDPLPCKCKSTAEHPCGESSLCLNRLTLVECHPKVCKAHGKCENQRFAKRAYPKMSPVKTPNRGWGLRCQEDIKKGTFVCEYVGEVIEIREFHRRVEEKMRNRDDDHYFISLDNTRIIDGGRKGNLARFINHSCHPNCKTEKWTVNGDTRIGIFAIEDVTAGSELTFNYLFESLAGAEKKPCLCGADNCAGFIGAKVKSLKQPKVDRKNLKAAKKKETNKEKKPEEDYCFRCEDGGELVLCDFQNCPKAYHLTCLELTVLPRGSWICPWHYCDECGSRASRLCKLCPNSFCTKHAQQGKIRFSQSENGLICSDHFSDDITESTENVDLSETESLQSSIGDLKIN